MDVKDGYTPGSKDVLSELRKNIFADPESADFQKQLKEVADFWESNFQYGEPNVQPDKNNSNEWIKTVFRIRLRAIVRKNFIILFYYGFFMNYFPEIYFV